MTRVIDITATRQNVPLERPLQFGRLTIRERSYCTVAVRLDDGRTGHARGIDRGVDVTAIVTELVAPTYLATSTATPAEQWEAALRAASPALSAGAGLRALSLVDIAIHDAHDWTNAAIVSAPPPVWVIIGYPPDSTPDDVTAEAVAAVAAGAAGVKLPVGRTRVSTRARAKAAIDAIGGSRVALDLAWTLGTAIEAARLIEDLDLSWVEDPFPPGRISELRALRQLTHVPLAVGDEDSQLYHPGALLDADAVDIVRLDAVAHGGITRLQHLAENAGTQPATSFHMSAHLHADLARRTAFQTLSVEISRQKAGVDPLDETDELEARIADLRT